MEPNIITCTDRLNAIREGAMHASEIALVDEMTNLAGLVVSTKDYMEAGDISQSEYDTKKNDIEKRALAAFYDFLNARFLTD